ncbi:MAG: GGDEF domain-containing protein [Comamonadaceae bacterium]
MRFHLSALKINSSPLAAVITVGAVVLGAELAIMLVFARVLEPLFGSAVPQIFWDLLDPFVLTAIVAPVLHFSVLRPMREQQAELQRNAEEIRQLAFYDSLTNLANRHLLHDRIQHTVAASKRTGFYAALLFLDLDNFKPLNDTHGHEAGDLLLLEVASRLKGCVREIDTVARFGGDEFVVLLSALDLDSDRSTAEAGIIAEKIRVTLAAPYILSITRGANFETVVEHQCTVSIGVVIFVNHEANHVDLLKWSDAAMYKAKEDGRNLVRFYDSTTSVTAICLLGKT